VRHGERAVEPVSERCASGRGRDRRGDGNDGDEEREEAAHGGQVER